MTVLVGYQSMPADATCPHCHDAHGMIETEAGLPAGTYRYRCWCGSSCKLTATRAELIGMGVPPERIPEESTDG